MDVVADNIRRSGYGLRMIQARQLMLRYSSGKTALSGMTLTIPKGRFVYLRVRAAPVSRLCCVVCMEVCVPHRGSYAGC